MNSLSADPTKKGSSVFPWKTNRYSCWVATNGQGATTTSIRNLTHEIGHTFGLLHTFESARLGSIHQGDNSQAGNCFQESVSRTRRQGIACLSTINQLKCMINGDYLSDTQADPKIQATYDVNVLSSGTCAYRNTKGTDNWGDTWTPAVDNLMSYSNRICTNMFTPMQKGVMYYYIQHYQTFLTLITHSNDQSFYTDADIDSYENDNFPENAKAISVGETQEHSFHLIPNGNPCDLDWLILDLNSNFPITISTNAIGNRPQANTRLILLDNSGNVIAQNDDANGSQYSQIITTLNAGTYRIRVENANSNPQSSGYYTINVSTPNTSGHITVSPQQLSIGNSAGTFAINTINSTNGWDATVNDPSWISISSNVCYVDDKCNFTLTVQPNTGPNSRTGTVTLRGKNGNDTETITITQAGNSGTGGTGSCSVSSPNSALDFADCNGVGGWAFDQNNLGQPVTIDIYVDGNKTYSGITANGDRQDLVGAFGNSAARYHGFNYSFPANASWKNGQNHTISVRICGVGNDMNGSPKTVNGCTGGTGNPPTNNPPTTNPPTSGCGFTEGQFLFTFYGEQIYAHYYNGYLFAAYQDASQGFKAQSWMLAASGAVNFDQSKVSCFATSDPRTSTPTNPPVTPPTNNPPPTNPPTSGCGFSDGQFLFTFYGEQIYAHYYNGYLFAAYQDASQGFKAQSWMQQAASGIAGFDQSKISCFATSDPRTSTPANPPVTPPTNNPTNPPVNPSSGSFEGYLDAANCDGLYGWVWNSSDGNSPVTIEFLDGSSVIGSVSASTYRQDLQQAGKGNGQHGYSWSLPNSLKNGQTHSVSVRVQGNGYVLSGSPKQISCSGGGRVGAVKSDEPKAEETVNLIVYPNPSNGHFDVSTSVAQGQLYTLQVTDLTGHTLLKREIISKGPSVTEAIDLPDSNLTNVIVQVKSGLKTASKRVVIHK